VGEAKEERIRRLPPGPHGLPPELVARNQRERLIAAMAEVCGERGYAESSVAEVAKRAGVSTASFYRQFKDRKECLLVSFEELFGRLLERIERACAGAEAGSERRRAAIATAAALLAADRPTARLLTVEIGAAGPDGVRALHRVIDRLAGLLRGPEARTPPASPDAAWARVAAMVFLAGLRVAEGKSPTAAELEEVAALS
jgi:AcrR family transcriptional regulator